MRNVVEGSSDIGVEYPLLGLVGSGQDEDFLDGIMTASAWSKPVTYPLEFGFPRWFKGVFHHRLKTAINDDRDSEWPRFAICLWDVYAARWFGFPEGVVSECIHHPSSGRWRFEDQFVHSRRVFPSIDLCYPPDADEPVGVAFQHEFLERAHLLQVALLCCPKDAVSQGTNSPVGFAPIDGVPVGLLLGSIC